MIFVPLPLFATFALILVVVRMAVSRDMSLRANQFFVGLVALYAVQSLLLCLRWGYGLSEMRLLIGLLAAVLPVLAYFAYLSWADRLSARNLWPLTIVALNWCVLVALPDLADGMIMMTYLCFGAAILLQARKRGAGRALVRLGQDHNAKRAMIATGVALIGSAFVDLFAVVDFIRNEGRNIPLLVTFVQTGLLLCIGLAAFAGPSVSSEEAEEAPAIPAAAQEADDVIIARLSALFEREALHLDTELNLRRLSRKLGLPDRSVSQAINRSQGKSVSQFVNEFRVRAACDLLRETDQTILQVSLAAGFMTKSNFNREFLRIVGQTPGAWRSAGVKP